MTERPYADKLSALIDRVDICRKEIETSLSPDEKYKLQVTGFDKYLEKLLTGDPVRDKEKIRQCAYDSKKFEEDYKATAKTQEAEFQQGRKEAIISLFDELLGIVGPTLSAEILARNGQIPFRSSPSSNWLSRNGATTSQSRRTTSDSLGATSFSSSDAGLIPDGHATANSQTSPGRLEPGLAATDGPRAEPRSRFDGDTHVRPSIDFDDVYQEGQAAEKHLIVEYPKESGDWYIVKCDRHGMRFSGEKPLSGAGRHLSSKAHNASGAHDEVIRILGISVQNCNGELAAKNNRAVKESEEAQRVASIQSKMIKRKKRRREDEGDLSDDADGLNDLNQPFHRGNRRNEGIINPVVGDIYFVYWEGDRKWYAGIVLSAEDCAQSVLPTLYRTRLLKARRPDCYIYDTDSRIRGWATGYEDGGCRVPDRQFPVLFFDQDEFPDSCQTAWVRSRNLKTFEKLTKDVPFARLVDQYLAQRQGKDSVPPQLTSYFGDQINQLEPSPSANIGTVDQSEELPENTQPGPETETQQLNLSTTTAPPAPECIADKPKSVAPGESNPPAETAQRPDESFVQTPTMPTKVEHSPPTSCRRLAETARYHPSQIQTTWSNREPYTIPRGYASPTNHGNGGLNGTAHEPAPLHRRHSNMSAPSPSTTTPGEPGQDAGPFREFPRPPFAFSGAATDHSRSVPGTPHSSTAPFQGPTPVVHTFRPINATPDRQHAGRERE